MFSDWIRLTHPSFWSFSRDLRILSAFSISLISCLNLYHHQRETNQDYQQSFPLFMCMCNRLKYLNTELVLSL